jgi:hypoxanthine phosphoribosyltransferase
MSDLPEEFKCTITNWDYIYDLCREVSNQVKSTDFEPEVVVALARGGWFAGRCVCDFLGLDDLTSLKMEHYVGTAQKTGTPTVRYPMPDGSVKGKDVLVIDDIADTGASVQRAEEYVQNRAAAEVRTGTLQLLETSEFHPDFVGEQLSEWTWVVYPWNFIEDMIDLITGVIQKDGNGPYTADEIRRLLSEFHDVGRMEMEIAQPGRLGEVLTEMTRRGGLETVDNGWRLRDPEAR